MQYFVSSLSHSFSAMFCFVPFYSLQPTPQSPGDIEAGAVSGKTAEPAPEILSNLKI